MAAAMTTTSTSAMTSMDSSSSSSQSPNKNRGVLSSPWALVVKGAGESPEKSESPPPEKLPPGEGNVANKTAWKKPSNAISTSPPLPPSGGGGGGVMGAVSWPALSESTRLKSSSDSSKSIPLSQGPVSYSQQQKSNANTNQNSNMNSARQRSMKHGGNRQGGFSRGSPSLPTLPEIAQSGFTKGVVPASDLAVRDSRPTGGFASHSNPSNEHSNYRSSNRQGNFGLHGRGDGKNNYHGGRRDQDNGNRNSSFGPHGRGAHGHPHRTHGRGFIGPPVQGTSPIAPPPPIRPYGSTLVYPVYYIPPLPTDAFRGMLYLTGPPPPPYLVMSDPLRASIIKQIEYYFSDANLVKDEFLRSKMDEQGWVPIALIANFPRVQKLTDNIPFILDCLKGSTIVEVQGDKLRRAEEWLKWIRNQ